MRQLVNIAGSASGIIGAAVCAISGFSRVSGNFYLAGYETTTLFAVGTGIMVFACLLKLEALAASTDRG